MLIRNSNAIDKIYFEIFLYEIFFLTFFITKPFFLKLYSMYMTDQKQKADNISDSNGELFVVSFHNLTLS